MLPSLPPAGARRDRKGYLWAVPATYRTVSVLRPTCRRGVRARHNSSAPASESVTRPATDVPTAVSDRRRCPGRARAVRRPPAPATSTDLPIRDGAPAASSNGALASRTSRSARRRICGSTLATGDRDPARPRRVTATTTSSACGASPRAAASRPPLATPCPRPRRRSRSRNARRRGGS